jgi:benzoyl-CoA 2,3-dioxygenase component B
VVRNAGAIDLSTLQRHINFGLSSSLDLFGAQISFNAASYFPGGLKGRPDEARFADHSASDQSVRIKMLDGTGGVSGEEVPMRSAMNKVARAASVRNCDVGVQGWNRLIAEAGYDFRVRLPSTRFHRAIGVWPVWRPTPRDARSPSRNGACGSTIGYPRPRIAASSQA